MVVGEPEHDGRVTTVTVDGGDWTRPATLLLEPSTTGFASVVGGGHLADDHEDRSGWWFAIHARDGRISVGGHLPAWAPGAVAVTVLPPADVDVTVGEAQLDHDGTFEVQLQVHAQATGEVVLLLTTRDGDRATSFALVRVPGGTFAAS